MAASPSPGIREMRERLDDGHVSSRELVAASLEKLARHDSTLNAFLHVNADEALAAADAFDRSRAAGEAPASFLAGVPLAVKDNICTVDAPTTCGSRLLEGWVPPYDATVVSRLRAAGAAIVGKTNLDEFGMGSSCENSGFGPTCNPADESRVPGGSSGGSAAAVAAGIVPAALGTDTGGSIRQPAAFCGIVGLKPTYGRVSRRGLVAFASSLDQIGPLGRSVEDVCWLLQAIWGPDPGDATSAPGQPPELSPKATSLEGRVFGLPREYLQAGLDPGVETALRAAVDRIEDAGARVEEISLPHTDVAIPTYYLLANAEASANLARFDGVRFGRRRGDPGDGLTALYEHTRAEGFGDEVKRRIMLGTYALSAGYYDAFYLRAQKVRTLIRDDFARAFETVSAILGPTAPTPAFKLGEKADDPVAMYLSDIFTVPVSLAGLPAISLPCGRAEGLPVGLQMVGNLFEEADLVATAMAVEDALGFPSATGS